MKTESIIDFQADRKTIQKSAINSIIIQIVFKLKGFITMPIMTYFLAPKEMGIYNLIGVTAALLTPIFYMNLADGPVVFFVQEKTKKRIQEMYNTVVLSSFVFFLLFSLIFLLIFYRYAGEKYRYLYLALPLIFSTIVYKLASYIFVVFQKTTIVLKNTLIRDAFETGLCILLVILGYSYRGMVFASIVSSCLAAVYIYQFAKHDFPLKFSIEWKILFKFLKISLPLLPVFFFSWVIQSSDSYFLLYYAGENSVGKYSIVYGLCGLILVLTWALNFFWFPFSAKLWIEDRERYRIIFSRLFVVFSAVLMIGVLFFEMNSKIIMDVLARRPEYRDAYAIMGVIALAFALQVLITLLTAPLYSNKNSMLIFVSYLVGGIANLGLNIFLIPSHGIWGAAISTAVSYGLVALLMSIFNYGPARFRFLEGRLMIPLGVFGILWVIIVLIRGHLSLYQILLIDIFIFLSFGSLIFFRILRRDEKEYLFFLYREVRSKLIPWEEF